MQRAILTCTIFEWENLSDMLVLYRKNFSELANAIPKTGTR
jgi:hypothetical protein